MKQVGVEEAVGMVLCHDITRIVPGEFKGRAFRKGHRVQAEDIPLLKDLGKEHLYVYDLQEGWIHEDDAALRIARAAAGPGITLSEPDQGRVNLSAAEPGLLKVDVEALLRINSVDEIVFSTLHTNQPVSAERIVAGTRIIPLVTREVNIEKVEEICRESSPVVSVRPFRPLQVGIVTTGSEVYSGRIEDKFGPVLRAKFGELGSCVMGQVLVADEVEKTVAAIHGFLDKGEVLLRLPAACRWTPTTKPLRQYALRAARWWPTAPPPFPGLCLCWPISRASR